MARNKSNMKQLKCQFICDNVPDFRALQNTKELPKRFNKTVEPYKYARKVFLKDALNGEILFILLKVKDQNTALEVLLSLLSTDIQCPVEALYQIYGNYDFLIELFGTSDQLNQARQMIQNADERIGVMDRSPFTISQKSRHWGFDVVNGGEPDPDSFTWLINAEKYNAIRAFMFCDASFKTFSGRDGFVKKLLASLDYPLNGSPNSIKASEIIDRIYFDENHRPVLGALCACGDYYHLNTLTNKIDSLLEQEYGLKGKETYVVAGTPHFSPVRSGLQVGFQNESQELLRKAVVWLMGQNNWNSASYRVVKGYYRRPEVADKLRTQVVSKIRKQCEPNNLFRSNWLIQGKSGQGKTFLFKQLEVELQGEVEFVFIDLDKESKNTWGKKLADVVKMAKKKPVLCLLDEMNKYRNETWPLTKLRGYLDYNKNLKSSGDGPYPIVWVLAGSEGETVDDLAECIQFNSKGLKRKNGRDIYRRIDNEAQIPPVDEVDAICVVCGNIHRLRVKKNIQCKYVEKRAVLFLLLRVGRDIEERIEAALERMKNNRHNETMTYGHLFEAEDQDRDKFLREFPQVAEFAERTLLISVE